MNRHEALARRLLGEQVDLPPDTTDTENIVRFLKTPQGAEAARSAIDRIVFKFNQGVPPTMPPHKEIAKTIEAVMSGSSEYQSEAASTDPMNMAAAQQRGFNRQDYTQ